MPYYYIKTFLVCQGGLKKYFKNFSGVFSGEKSFANEWIKSVLFKVKFGIIKP